MSITVKAIVNFDWKIREHSDLDTFHIIIDPKSSFEAGTTLDFLITRPEYIIDEVSNNPTNL